jgi:uncharacterized protein (DUF433 family)
MTEAEILGDFPYLEPEDIKEAIEVYRSKHFDWASGQRMKIAKTIETRNRKHKL